MTSLPLEIDAATIRLPAYGACIAHKNSMEKDILIP